MAKYRALQAQPNLRRMKGAQAKNSAFGILKFLSPAPCDKGGDETIDAGPTKTI
jgi:hypothetical protein